VAVGVTDRLWGFAQICSMAAGFEEFRDMYEKALMSKSAPHFVE
jgi:hypothetical protein